MTSAKALQRAKELTCPLGARMPSGTCGSKRSPEVSSSLDGPVIQDLTLILLTESSLAIYHYVSSWTLTSHSKAHLSNQTENDRSPLLTQLKNIGYYLLSSKHD